MAIDRTRKLIYTGAAAVGILLGATGVAAAVTSSTSPPTSPLPAASADQQHDDGDNFTSSAKADSEDQAALEGAATVTPEQAIAAATASAGGTASDAVLENENGNVVYSVIVTLPDGSQVDVKVDAGNATVVATDSEFNDDQNGAVDEKEGQDEKNDAPEAGESADQPD